MTTEALQEAAPETYVRAHPVVHHANEAKLARIRELLPPWRQGCHQLVRKHLVVLQSGAHLPRFIDTQGLPTGLSARQWKSAWNQSRAALASWLGNLKRIVRGYLQKSSLDGDLAIECFRINAGAMWWVPSHKDFSDEALRLSRALVKQAIKRCPPPRLRRLNTMVMDGPIASVEPSDTDTFSSWLRVATLQPRKRVSIPFDEPADPAGEPTSVVQVTVAPDGRVVVRRCYRHQAAEARDTGRELGLDWGLRSLFATSDGRLLGIHLFDWLKARDKELTDLTRALARNKVRYRDSSRYNALNQRIRGHVTNEVNRVLNKLTTEDVSRLVVESLDFRNTNLSRRMNRILTRAGRGAVRKKLESMPVEHGIEVIQVNPAYTSQECSGCGFIREQNRSDTRFRCGFCGKTLQADINGARVIMGRRSAYAGGLLRMSRRQVRVVRDLAFQERWAATSLDKHARTAGLDPSNGSQPITM